jgi:hypothetical protein
LFTSFFENAYNLAGYDFSLWKQGVVIKFSNFYEKGQLVGSYLSLVSISLLKINVFVKEMNII